MFEITLDELEVICQRVRELKERASGMTAEEYECQMHCKDILEDIKIIMYGHGAIAFFTRKEHQISVPLELTDKLQKVLGWL